ncbi:MAG TPA: DNA double-strand break repair nuclease NurA [Anaerolineales bacterium]
MPVDYQQVYDKIRQIGLGSLVRREELKKRREQARELLERFSSDLDFLRSRVEAAKAVDVNFRCAMPVDEPLDAACPPPASIADGTVIAVDGSQINPDRHEAIQFCLVNVGAVVMVLNSGHAPGIQVESELLYGDEMLSHGIPLNEGMVAMRRDIREREKLEQLARYMEGNVLTLTDGPIELWGAKGDDPQAYNEFVDNYRTVLSRLSTRGVVHAGYVEKPTADLVLYLLEIAVATEQDLRRIRDYHPLRGVSDRWLYGERRAPLLPPGHRSAVFKLVSGSDKNYTGALSLHFFYLNVGSDGHPWPVRVEIPRWVVDDRLKLDLLHCVLLEQCKIMGHRPYPYILHRAHETAVVKHDEKLQITEMLAQELRQREEEMDDISNKQNAKNLPGRRRR